ncbi:hypothetical protein GCM10029964_065210 [Kibdelosporangium lantanae]
MTDRQARRDPSDILHATGFRESIRDGWGSADRSVRLAPGAAEAAAAHRTRLSEQLPGRRIAIASGAPPVRANDTDYGFRPDSDFSWLTGCNAPGAVLVMQPTGDGHDAVLYLREPAGPTEVDFFADARDGELWIGPTPGWPSGHVRLASPVGRSTTCPGPYGARCRPRWPPWAWIRCWMRWWATTVMSFGGF